MKADSRPKRKYSFKFLLMCYGFYFVLKLLHLSFRYRVFGMENRRKAESWCRNKTFIIATWHGDSYVGTFAHSHQNMAPLCSQSKDGQLVAFACKRIGVFPVNGSSSRGGKAARDELLNCLERGICPAITVDGPKGPPCEVKPGVIAIAAKSQAAILPMIAIPDRYIQLRSWDKLKIPMPFARVAVVYGEPIAIPPEPSEEQFKQLQSELAERLNDLRKKGSELLSENSSGWLFRLRKCFV